MNPRFLRGGGDEKAATTTTKRASDISAACTGETDIERTNEAFNFPADDLLSRDDTKMKMLKTTTIETRRRHRHRWFPVAVLAMICAQAQAPLAFAAQSVQFSDPNLKYYQLAGSGTTNPSKPPPWTSSKRRQVVIGLRMTYRSVGSGTGATDWILMTLVILPAPTTVLPVPAVQRHLCNCRSKSGAVSLFINIPGVGTGEMKLSVCTVAKIFTGVITNWDHADIATDSGLSLPSQTIKVIWRSNGSSSTFGLKVLLEQRLLRYFHGRS